MYLSCTFSFFLLRKHVKMGGYGEGGDLEGLEGEEEEDDQNIFKFKNLLNNKYIIKKKAH